MADKKVEQDDSIARVDLATAESSIPDKKSTSADPTAPKIDVWDILEKIKEEIIEKYKEDTRVKTENLKQQFEKIIKDTKKELEEKIDDSKLRIIETLGIFVALFTFVSVNFNIFNRVADLWSAGIFTLLIFSVLSLMILIMDILLMKIDNWLDFRIVLFLLM